MITKPQEIKSYLLIFFLAASVVGCSHSVPKCNDSKSVELVKQIARDERARKIGAEKADSLAYTVKYIRTLDVNKKTGAYECAASLTIQGNALKKNEEMNITYTVELTDDSKHVYVSVQGLKQYEYINEMKKLMKEFGENEFYPDE